MEDESGEDEDEEEEEEEEESTPPVRLIRIKSTSARSRFSQAFSSASRRGLGGSSLSGAVLREESNGALDELESPLWEQVLPFALVSPEKIGRTGTAKGNGLANGNGNGASNGVKEKLFVRRFK